MRACRRSTALIITTIGLLTLPLSQSVDGADSVYLRTGELLTGKILRITEKELAIQLQSGGILAFKLHSVLKVKRQRPGMDLPETIFFNRKKSVGNESPTSPSAGPDDAKPSLLPQPTLDPRPQAVTTEVPAAGSPLPAAKKSWKLEPPPGFAVAPPEKSANALQVWIDPAANAEVILTTQPSGPENLEQISDAVLKTLGTGKENRVIRNQAVQRGGVGGYRGWLLEVEHDLSGAPTRQIQLFTRANNRTFILSYTCPTADYPALARFFEESLESFRLFDPAKNSRPLPK